VSDFLVRPVQVTDRNWIESFVKSHRGSEIVVAKGHVIRPSDLDGFAAFRGKKCCGPTDLQN
jgi:hypothetical protein